MKLLYYLPWSYGGLSDYAHPLSNAITDLGIDVTILCSPHYLTGNGERYKCSFILQEIVSNNPSPNKILRGLRFARITIQNYFKLVEVIKNDQFEYVLMGAYAEYFAPIWSPPFRQLAQKGVIFGAIIHDPVRNTVLGPLWWHRWSIACAYSFLREAFVHESTELDTVWSIPGLRTTVIPHGSYQFGSPSLTKEVARASFNLPHGSKVMLAFGHIRDNKNLDLILQAMVQFPDVYLIVAGREQSASQLPAGFYQELATSLGVSERCRWYVRFIQNDEIANFFEASDFVLLTYSGSFCSASGVLNTAVYYRKPCLVSSGKGSLKTVVQEYELGVWIEPDNINSISSGICKLIETPPKPNWNRYMQENSWTASAESIIKSFKSAKKHINLANTKL